MDLQRFASQAPDEATAHQLAEIRNAANAAVAMPRMTAPDVRKLFASPDERSVGLWLAYDDEVLVGWVHLAETIHDYLSWACLRGAVHPDRQRHGIGRELLTVATGATRRPVLRTRSWQNSAGTLALPRLGFAPRNTMVVSELTLAGTDWAVMAQPPEGYVFERWIGPTPARLLEDMVVLREAINDAPDATENESYPVQRIVDYEHSLADQGQTQYTVVARHQASGEPAGITFITVNESEPALAQQEDTSVLPSHRGHRLGVRLKADMAAWLRSQRPDVRTAHTWNDLSNSHMLAVNAQLGARQVARSTAWELER